MANGNYVSKNGESGSTTFAVGMNLPNLGPVESGPGRIWIHDTGLQLQWRHLGNILSLNVSIEKKNYSK